MKIRFTYDAVKNRRNIEKHGISFETAKLIFDGPLYSEEDFRFEYGEVRMKSFGSLPNLVVVVVIHVDYEEDGTLIIRIISARKADKREQRIYYENL